MRILTANLSSWLLAALTLGLGALAPSAAASAPRAALTAPVVVQDSLLQEAQELLRKPGADSAREALARFRTFRERYPEDLRGVTGAATAWVRLRRPHEAVRLLREAHERAPASEPVLFNLAACLHNQTLFEEAIVHWRALRDLADVNPALAARTDWMRSWGQAASKLELGPEALEAYQRCVRLAPNDAKARAELALELLGASRFEDAAKELERVVQSRPQDATTHYQLGWSYLQLGRGEDALRELKASVEIDPSLVDAHLKLGTLYAREERHSEAIASYRAALSANPASGEALHALARLLARTGDKAGSQEVTRRYEEVNARFEERTEVLRGLLRDVAAEPDNVAAYEAAARFYLEEADAGNAETWLLRLLWRDPDNVNALLNLSTILARRGDFAAAELEVEKVLEREPQNLDGNLQLARILCSQRRWTEALPLLETALPLAGDARPQVEALLSAARSEARRRR